MSKHRGTLRKTLGANISAIRRQRQHTQESFAETAKISLSTLQKIESGKQWPGAEILEVILSALNTTLGEVADFSAEAPPSHPEVMEQIKVLKGVLDLIESSESVVKMRGIERRLSQAEPQARAYKALEAHLGHELIQRLKITTKEDLELLKATLPKPKSCVKKLHS